MDTNHTVSDQLDVLAYAKEQYLKQKALIDAQLDEITKKNEELLKIQEEEKTTYLLNRLPTSLKKYNIHKPDIVRIYQRSESKNTYTHHIQYDNISILLVREKITGNVKHFMMIISKNAQSCMIEDSNDFPFMNSIFYENNTHKMSNISSCLAKIKDHLKDEWMPELEFGVVLFYCLLATQFHKREENYIHHKDYDKYSSIFAFEIH